jgi:hypothetical protein
MATLYFRSTGTNWGNAGDWSTTASPSYTGGSVPTAADDVIFEAASANCIVNSINRLCKSITFATYTNEIQMSFNITVSGNITFGASMQVHPIGSGAMICSTTSTITTNGFVWPNAFNFGVTGISQTYTLADNMEVNGLVTCVGTTALTINGAAFTLTCNGGLVCTTATSGTATIRLRGGNWSGTCNNTLNLDSTGTITLTGNIGRVSGTLTYVTGTIDNSGNYSLSYTGGSINVGNNILWNNITLGTAAAVTLVNDLYAAGTLIYNNGGGANGAAYKIYCNSLQHNNNTNNIIGSATIEFTGAGIGTWSSSSTSVAFGQPVVINKSGGTLTIADGRIHGTLTGTTSLMHTAGTVICSGTYRSYNSTLTTNGMTFNNVSFGAAGTSVAVTLGNAMDIAGNLTVTSTAGLTINNNQINLSGSFINNMTTASSGGTTIINMVGTGNIQTTGTPTNWTNPITINSSSGTITWSGTNGYNGNLIYTAGTIVSTSSILNRNSGTMTINANGFNLATLNLTGNCQFLGTNGFTITSLNCTTAGVVSRWTPTNEYIITTAFNSGQTDGISKITYTSSNNAVIAASFGTSVMTVTSVAFGTILVGDTVFGEGVGTGVIVLSQATGTTGGVGTYNLSLPVGTLLGRTIITSPNITSYPKITLTNGATQSLYYTNAIDVDSNNGQTIWSFGSTLLRAFNWNIGTRPNGFSFAWVR